MIEPKLIADHYDRMRIAALILTWLEAAAENGMNTDSVEIVRRDNAAGRDFGVIADIQRAASNRSDESIVAERTVSAQIEKVGPGKKIGATLPL